MGPPSGIQRMFFHKPVFGIYPPRNHAIDDVDHLSIHSLSKLSVYDDGKAFWRDILTTRGGNHGPEIDESILTVDEEPSEVSTPTNKDCTSTGRAATPRVSTERADPHPDTTAPPDAILVESDEEGTSGDDRDAGEDEENRVFVPADGDER